MQMTKAHDVAAALVVLTLFATTASAQTSDTDRCTTAQGEGAIAACSEIIAAGDGADVAWAQFDRGRAYFNAKMYGSAISDLTDVLHLKPADIEALENRALAFLAMDDYPHATSDFSRLIDLQPQQAKWFRDRCFARAVSKRDLDDAMEDCNQALTLRPGDASALDARCFVQMRAAAYALAIADCSAAIAANQTAASSYYLRGVAKIKTGDLARGDADLSTAKALDPEIAETFAVYDVKP